MQLWAKWYINYLFNIFGEKMVKQKHTETNVIQIDYFVYSTEFYPLQ